jgi:hypothetical protein
MPFCSLKWEKQGGNEHACMGYKWKYNKTTITCFSVPNSNSAVCRTSEKWTIWYFIIGSNVWKYLQWKLIRVVKPENLICSRSCNHLLTILRPTHLNSPNTRIVIKKWRNLSNFLDVFNVPNVNTVIVVHTCQLQKTNNITCHWLTSPLSLRLQKYYRLVTSLVHRPSLLQLKPPIVQKITFVPCWSSVIATVSG